MTRRTWMSLCLVAFAGPALGLAQPSSSAQRLSATGTGEIIISEIFYDPTEVNDAPGGVDTYGDGEFIELYNPGSLSVNLNGWDVQVFAEKIGDPRLFTIDVDVIVPPGGYVVLASQSDLGVPGYGVTADFVWPRPSAASFFIRNDAEDITLFDGSDAVSSIVVFDEASGWPTAEGASIQLAPTLLAESYAEIPDAWCLSVTNLGAGPDKGTPGVANDTCAGIDGDGDGHFTAEEDCDDAEAAAHFDLIETPDDGVDNDCDGIELTTVAMDAGGDAGSSPNDITGFYMGWDATNLVFGFDTAIQDRAWIWHFDMGIAGGETNFRSSQGWGGQAFPTSVTHQETIEFMAATYGGNPLFVYNIVDGASTDVTAQADSVLRTNESNDGNAGFGFVRIPWDVIYGLGAGVVPADATLKIAGLIRAGDDASPYGEDLLPDNGGDPISNYMTVVVDSDGDGVADDGGGSVTPTPSATPATPTVDPSTPTPDPPTATPNPPTPTEPTDGDSDGFNASEDCDDGDALINPDADEILCNGIDENCSGDADDAPDDDGDGYDVCEVTDDGDVDGLDADCDDAAFDTNPGASETICDGIDNDCDGGTEDAPDDDGDFFDLCDPGQDGDTDGEPADCDDDNADAKPDGVEITCNGVDEDCSVATADAPDVDGDGYDICAPGNAGDTDGEPADCEDTIAGAHPGATEITCNGINDDCISGTDDSPDVDGDGYDLCAPSVAGDDDLAADCDDDEADVNPGEVETTCNGVNDDCSSVSPDAPDVDGDGYDLCDPTDPGPDDGNAADCDDGDKDINPGEDEITCNGVDEDCDSGTVDAPDVDNDGYDICDPSDPGPDDNRAADCDDDEGQTNPGADERECNGVDDDCDPGTQDGPDVDGDGFDICGGDADCDDDNGAINPDATEVCDDADNNCDGAVDEASAADAQTWYLDADSDTYGRNTGGVTQCDAPSSVYVNRNGDCDDLNTGINPDASETCNRDDDDCDGKTDEDFDADSDTYFDADVCSFGTDCDDEDGDINPDATESCDGVDENCDNVGDDVTFDTDGDGFLDNSASCSPSTIGGKPATDCDDDDDEINPAADEICDSIDNDCDTRVDDADTDTIGEPTWYTDADGDGYGDENDDGIEACVQPKDYVANNGDCDDSDTGYNPGIVEDCDDPTDYNCDGASGYENNDGDSAAACEDCDDNDNEVYPGAPELCDGKDNDCDERIDDADDDATNPSTWYPDVDDDDSRANTGSVELCDAPQGYIADTAPVDCDDSDDNRSPLNSETCDEVDNDCDSTVDEDTLTVYYEDVDEDTYGDPDSTQEACTVPDGFVTNSLDCDDDNVEINPDTLWYVDSDSDGYGNNSIAPQQACVQPTGYVQAPEDCDDTDNTVNPGATLLCDGKDNDCDDLGDLFEGFDADSDTHLSAALCGELGDDCDDSNANINPDKPDLGGNEVDENCDDVLYDVDGDGFGVDEGDCNDLDAAIGPNATEIRGNDVDENCDGNIEDQDDDDFSVEEGDCDDLNAGINPDAADICGNEIDEDCNGVDFDADCDGYGVEDNDCDDTDADINPGVDDIPGNDIDENCDGAPDDVDDDGYTLDEGDCDDEDATRYPDAAETPYDGIDQDCDEKDWTDVDGDGFDSTVVDGGDDCDDSNDAIHPDASEIEGNEVDEDCDGEAYDIDADGYGVTEGDCNDSDADVNPGVEEICGNVIDENCDGEQILACADVDADGFSADEGDCKDEDATIYPDAPEVCGDAIDNNCNSVVDEGCEEDVSFFGGCSISGGGARPESVLGLLALLVPAALIRRKTRSPRPQRR